MRPPRGELELHFQPKLNLADRSVTITDPGVEIVRSYIPAYVGFVQGVESVFPRERRKCF